MPGPLPTSIIPKLGRGLPRPNWPSLWPATMGAPLKLRAARRALPPVLLRPNQGRGELPLDALILPGPFPNLHRLPLTGMNSPSQLELLLRRCPPTDHLRPRLLLQIGPRRAPFAFPPPHCSRHGLPLPNRAREHLLCSNFTWRASCSNSDKCRGVYALS